MTAATDYGVGAPALDATSPVVHFRCDRCPKVEAVPHPARRPEGWLTVTCFGRTGRVLTELCDACAPNRLDASLYEGAR